MLHVVMVSKCDQDMETLKHHPMEQNAVVITIRQKIAM